MNIDFIVLHGSAGIGKSTLAKRLHEQYKSPYFEFGWIPEFRMLAPSIEISQRQEEQLSFENLITVVKNYNKHGFKNIILTDLNDIRLFDIPNVFAEYNYVIITLYTDSDEVIKQRILTRDNGNQFMDWNVSIKINEMIKRRGKLPNEYRICSKDNPNSTYEEIINLLKGHKPSINNHISYLTKDMFYSYILD